MIAILGSTGYVGGKYLDHLVARGIPSLGLSRGEVDYTVVETLCDWLQLNRPSLLINAAGFTGKPNVDACESQKADCLFGNAVLPGRIREACEATGTPWGHVSSGCIYQGRNPDGLGWSEEDSPNFSFRSPPCSFYSGSKALGEETLTDADQCYVWRMRVPFNHESSSRSYIYKILTYERLLDVENSLSHIDDFIEATLNGWERRIPFGLYNLTNPGSVTTRQIVDWIKEEGLTDKKFSFFESEDEFMEQVAQTPRSSCVLDTSKLAAAGIELRSVEEAVRSSLCKLANAKKVISA